MGILLAIHVLTTILLILIVLVQKNEGGSSLFANSGGNGMFNARGTSNILTKATWTLAAIFLINCIVMATIDSSRIRNAQSIIERTESPAQGSSNNEDASADQSVSDDEQNGEDEEFADDESATKKPDAKAPKQEASDESGDAR